MNLPVTRFGDAVRNVFALAGENENSATAAVGWALSKSPSFVKKLLDDVLPAAPRMSLHIDLQRRSADAGFTDIEIRGSDLHLIIEAKVGAAVPSKAQLHRYVGRMKSVRHRLLLSVSDAPAAYARRRLPSRLRGVGVLHRTWRDIRTHVSSASASTTSSIEKLWLHQLEQHLEDYVRSRRTSDNTVYVVSLSKAPMEKGGTLTWIDVVKERRYFHLAKKGWPSEPPNYIGFRYDGRLQSIHRVESWEIVDQLKTINAEWPSANAPHFVYKLGPGIEAADEVRTGRIFRNGRVYAAIDLLLSGACKTISDAVLKTKKRLAAE